MMRVLRPAVCILLVCTLAKISFAQQPSSAPIPSRDPQATLSLQSALSSLAGTNSLTDVTLTGTATRTAGSDSQTGTATLKATAAGQSRVDLALSGGLRSEVRDASQAPPVGQWLGPSASIQPISEHNLMTEPAWFFPALAISRVLTNPSYSLSAIDQETKNGSTVNHLTVYLQANVPSTSQSRLQALSQMDIYLDPTSSLPVAIDLNTHPDDNALLNIPVEYQFSNYQTVQGMQVPFHVQQLVNNVVLLDIQISQVTLNTGLTNATFSLE